MPPAFVSSNQYTAPLPAFWPGAPTRISKGFDIVGFLNRATLQPKFEFAGSEGKPAASPFNSAEELTRPALSMNIIHTAPAEDADSEWPFNPMTMSGTPFPSRSPSDATEHPSLSPVDQSGKVAGSMPLPLLMMLACITSGKEDT